MGFGGQAAVEGLAQMSGSGFERWWSTGDFRWSVRSRRRVPVVLFGAALKSSIIVGTLHIVTETEGFMKEHDARRNPLRTVFAALMVGGWWFGDWWFR